ncbi:putative leukotriene A-4 hydrolase (LTA-4 hydrolase) (Leukotriene A(4) hydrolase) [Rhizophlyctis rosea]|nr:putative leukotriene A-4 hydrolase (LTA-4 hydrolase) (Leukotriene A(4) hydrolase) [Rhizophlyctis rosea]
MAKFRADHNSFANTRDLVVKHLNLVLSTDFDKRVLAGHVDVTATVQRDGATSLVLDTSYLDIRSAVIVDENGKTGENIEFSVSDRHDKYGSALQLRLPRPTSAQQSITIRINYSTTDKCTALQWLTPSQTDTPSVKITYSAELSVPSHLRALMSAVRKGEEVHDAVKTFKFDQPIAIPSYLIALAVGNIDGRQVGHRTTVWSEPEVVDSAAWEFSETETFITTGEKLLTPYVWGIYDLLLLPASFPYGGMENPCLTFVTPTLLAGDRSLVDVVAHEISHSWMGNLVTTQNWEHFWLNEGFTVFIERKIEGRLHGQEALEFDAIIGFKALKESVDHFKEVGHEEYSALVPKLKDQDPDDAFSSVPYEKGFNLLFYLEKLLGGPAVFEPYVKAHVEKFSHKSITTSDFKDFLYEYFKNHDPAKLQKLEAVDWDAWFHKPGMPIVDNQFDQTLARACEDLANKWDAARDAHPTPWPRADFEKFITKQKIVFLEKLLLKKPFPHRVLETLDASYELSKIKNAEIRFRWQWLCLNAEYENIFPQVVEFVTSVGRMKFVRPLFRQLNKCKNGSELAKKTFLEHRAFYHPICAGMVAKDLGLN